MSDLYTGVTLSGKTTLARYHARILAQRSPSVPMIIRDPVAETKTAGGDWPENAEIYSETDEYMERIVELVSSHQQAYSFIDEAADLLSLQHPENFWLATRGRHYGIHFGFITQRPKLIAPSVRTNCTRVFMFRLARKDMVEVLADVGHDIDIIKKPLDTGDFIMLKMGSAEYHRMNVFTDVLKSNLKGNKSWNT